MNQYYYQDVYSEPRWHKWVDGLVIMIIGVVAGIVFAQGMNFYDVQTTTQTVRNGATYSAPLQQDEQSGNVAAPQSPIKFEDI